MKTIQLTKGYAAKVDDKDFVLISKYKWCAVIKKGLVYAKAHIDGKTTFMHTFVFGKPPVGHVIDHRNGNTLDNRGRNLRLATFSQNCSNRKNRRSKKYLGVAKLTRNNKRGDVNIRWYARVMKNGTMYSVRAISETDAAIKYNELAALHHGEFATLNKIRAAA